MDWNKAVITMESRCQQVTLSLNNYPADDDVFSEEALYGDLLHLIKALLKNNYVCVIRNEDYDSISVEFENDEQIEEMGCANPYWLYSDEYLNSINTPEDFIEEDKPQTPSEQFIDNKLSFFD